MCVYHHIQCYMLLHTLYAICIIQKLPEMSISLFSDFYYYKWCFRNILKHPHMYCWHNSSFDHWKCWLLDFSLKHHSCPIWRQSLSIQCHFHPSYHTCDHSPHSHIYYPSLGWWWEPGSSFKKKFWDAGLNNYFLSPTLYETLWLSFKGANNELFSKLPYYSLFFPTEHLAGFVNEAQCGKCCCLWLTITNFEASILPF